MSISCDLVDLVKDDDRILYWCLYNEPENLKDGRNCLEFMTEMYKWAWEIRPSQPLTSPVWHRPGFKGATTKLDMVAFVLTNSDIITFHCYYTPAELETFINMLSMPEYVGRILFCSLPVIFYALAYWALCKRQVKW